MEQIVRTLLAVMFFFSLTPGWAAEATITDGDTLVLNGIPYRLDGVDAPETDQLCVDKAGTIWTCGIEARDQLSTFVNNRDVRCDGLKYDTVYRNRRIAICQVEGETLSLNRWLVQQGWALNFEPYAKGRFKVDEDEARSKGRGIWAGCFAKPQEARRGNKTTAVLLGTACSRYKNEELREKLFPSELTMPTGCAIKGKFAVRAQVTGHRGIYHLEGCRSYGRTKTPDRWFCSEKEAQAEGFRKSFTCF
jgi:endonuclease YncB( thermonuclease family)